MSAVNILAIVSALACSPTATAQKPTLKLGDKAPAFRAAGFVKGSKVNTLVKGKTYVIEFWATWCGPCIGAMPHLSNTADKFKGKATFISVNTWDTKNETFDAHTKRVKKWVDKNSKMMRYNVALDDAKDSLATSWIKASGQVGIPCSFIVNDQGNIAWIGDPMKIEKPLKAVLDKKWNIEAYRSTLQKETERDRKIIETEQESMRAFQKRMQALVEANDRKSIDAFVKNSSERAAHVIQVCLPNHAEMAYDYWKQFASKKTLFSNAIWTMNGSVILINLKDASKRSELVKLSESIARLASKKEAAEVYMYHARTIHLSGDTTAAKRWLEKAKAAVSTYEPASKRDSMSESIDYYIHEMSK